MKRMISIVVLVLAVACGGGGKKESSTTATASAVLTMQPASLSATVDGKPMDLALDASGQVMMNGKLVATLTAAGEAKDANGKTLATVASDGKVTIVGEPTEDIVIGADGAVTAKGEAVIGIGSDGILAGKLISDKDAKVAYKGPSESKRAIMLAWLVVSTPATKGDAPPPH